MFENKLYKMFLELEFIKFLKFLKDLKQDDFEATFINICDYIEKISDSDLKVLIVFFSDDYFINNTQISDKWRINLLETKFYGTMIGGDKFLKNYEKFQNSQLQLRDLYILSTKLGYKVFLEDRKYNVPFITFKESYDERYINTQNFSFFGILFITFIMYLLVDFVELKRVISIVIKDIINWK